MEAWIFGLLDKAIEISKKGGDLPTSAILFLVCFGMGIFIYRWKKQESEETLKRLEAWQDGSKAQMHLADSVEQVADGLKMVADAQTATANQVAILIALEKYKKGIE